MHLQSKQTLEEKNVILIQLIAKTRMQTTFESQIKKHATKPQIKEESVLDFVIDLKM